MAPPLRSIAAFDRTRIIALGCALIAIFATAVAMWGVSSGSRERSVVKPLDPTVAAELRAMFDALTDGLRELHSDLIREHLLIASVPMEVEYSLDNLAELTGLSNMHTAVAIRLQAREHWKWSDVLTAHEIIDQTDDMVQMRTSTGHPAVQLAVSRPIRNGEETAAFLVFATNARSYWTHNVILLKREAGVWKSVSASMVGYY